MSYKVLIVDDSALVRRSIRACIEQDSDWEVCGEAENGEVAVARVKDTHPDVVILDFQMPVMNGFDAARLIVRIAPKTKLLMLTLHLCDQIVEEARVIGFMDVLSKSDNVAGHLIASLKSASAQSQLFLPRNP
jgi:DNA-binding NarL/FixJ family response regulator